MKPTPFLIIFAVLVYLGVCVNACPSWTQHEGRCYHVSTHQMTNSDARTYCESKGAHLIDINSATEDSFAFDLAKAIVGTDKRVHIGLNDAATEGTFVWSDGSAPGYTHWEPAQPNGWGNSDCVILRNQGDWNDVPCSESVRALCEASTCLSWDQHEGSCYHVSALPMTNSAAKTYCEDAGAHLIDINSAGEDSFAFDLAKAIVGNDRRVYIGLNDAATEGTFVWSDGSSPEYTHWEPNQPNGWGNADCIILRNQGDWNDVPCSEQVRALCEVLGEVSVETSGEVAGEVPGEESGEASNEISNEILVDHCDDVVYKHDDFYVNGWCDVGFVRPCSLIQCASPRPNYACDWSPCGNGEFCVFDCQICNYFCTRYPPPAK